MTRRYLPGEIPPPEPDDYMRALDMTVSCERIANGRDVLEAIGRHRGHEGSYNYYVREVATYVGVAIEPFDKHLGRPFDEEQRVAHAVIRGMAFARLFIPRAHDPVVQLGDLVPTFPEGLEKIDDAYDRNQAFARYFVDCGERGVDLMSDQTVSQLEAFEDEVADSVSAQRFFRTGCGIVAYAALQAHASYNRHVAKSGMQDLQQAVDAADSDWDEALRRLTGDT